MCYVFTLDKSNSRDKVKYYANQMKGHTMHPWHQVEHYSEFPNIIPAIIEVPKGSQIKYELDKKSGLLKVDRILYSAVHYPANYGFIPRTYGDDNDPLDVLLLCSEQIEPMTLVRAYPIGVISMIDNGNFPIEFLSKCAKARFKVGRYAFKGHAYDLIVSGAINEDLRSDSRRIFQEITEFLLKIK